MWLKVIDPALKLNQIFIRIYGLKDPFYSNEDRDEIRSRNLFPRIYFFKQLSLI